MADLEFKRNVPQIPAGPELPEVKRSVSAEVSPVPDYQGGISKYAADTNWMSALGSSIATNASNMIATKLGGEMGRTPKGELPPSFTDFDKTLSQSYNTQAYATLGIQASELITNSNLEMAKAPRITPELITSTNKQVSLGLQNIYKNAPNEIRSKLEYSYNHQQLAQTAQLTERMLKEQKQDRKDNTAYASQVNGESAHYLASLGQFDAAMRSVQATQDINEADEAAGVSNKSVTKTHVDSNRQSALSGKIQYEYEQAKTEGKGEEFLAKLADPKNFPDMTYEDYKVVSSRLLGYIGNQEKLKREDATLAVAKFSTKLVDGTLTPDDITETKSHLDPIQQQKLDLYYAKAVKAQQKQTAGVTKALAVYTNVDQFPLQSDENKDKAWEQTTQSILNTPESIASNLTLDDARLRAAAIAPVKIPAYIKQLTAKAESTDPQSLEIAGQQINYLRSHNMGEKLGDFDKRADAVVDIYGKLRGIMPPLEAAKQAHETVYNKSKDQKDANIIALQAFYDSQKKSGETNFTVVKRLLGTSSNLKIRNLPGYIQKATQLFDSYFDVTNGDETISMEKTKQIMDTQYGESNINNEPELMYHPIENIPGIPHDAIGAIQSDIIEQANIKFQIDKKFYDDPNGKSDSWYEARQKISADEALTSQRYINEINEGYRNHPISRFILDLENRRDEYNNHLGIVQAYKNGQPITIVKHNRSGKDEVYEGVIQANPWGVKTGIPTQPIAGGWDLMLKTPNGAKSIMLRDPLSSSTQYNPRVDYIQNLYSNIIGESMFESITKPNLETQKLEVSHFYQPLSKMLEQ